MEREFAERSFNHRVNCRGAEVNVKLFILKIRKFTGKIHEFQEFWDSFGSAIHDNDALSKVDKFKYLKSYLEDQARSATSGIPLTDNNYGTAVHFLQERFREPKVIQHFHLNQLLNLMPVLMRSMSNDCVPCKTKLIQISVDFKLREWMQKAIQAL